MAEMLRIPVELSPDEIRGAIAVDLRMALQTIEDPMFWGFSDDKLKTIDECAYRVRYLVAVMQEAGHGEE